MTQKTVSLTERAYKLLKKAKLKGESFSDVIERVFSKEKNPWLVARKRLSTDFFEGLKEDVNQMREDNLVG